MTHHKSYQQAEKKITKNYIISVIIIMNW